RGGRPGLPWRERERRTAGVVCAGDRVTGWASLRQFVGTRFKRRSIRSRLYARPSGPSSPFTDGAHDRIRDLCRVLVLPEPQRQPLGGEEHSVNLSIAFDIADEFGRPVMRVSPRRRGVLRAAVPEAAIDVDRDALR